MSSDRRAIVQPADVHKRDQRIRSTRPASAHQRLIDPLATRERA
jgi:hypothetical protein